MAEVKTDDILYPTFAHKLGERGVTDEHLIGKLKEELEACETKFFQKDGVVLETKDVIAWNIRQNARENAHKLRGDYPAEKLDHTVTVENEMSLAVRVFQESKKKKVEDD